MTCTAPMNCFKFINIFFYRGADLFKVLSEEPLLFKHTRTKTDGIRAMSKERSHVPGPHPATCQELDIIKGAFNLPEIFRSEKIRRKNFHHRSSGIPGRIDL